jgi:non-lysosomal glucosylceramidase
MPDPNDCGPDCACVPKPLLMPRRDFLSLGGLSMLATALAPWPVMAGPFDTSALETADFAKLVPPDKKLHPDWIRSLFVRGRREVYTKTRHELRYIGMPIGGLCCGTLYLGGDGKLWLWDIFNRNQEGVITEKSEWVDFSGQKSSVGARDGAAYVAPHTEQSPLEQGFALRVNGVTRSLDVSSWEEITFSGEYPLGTVVYTDPHCPLTVTLTAYSPFIPLDTDDSGLPATICEFTLHNTSQTPVEAELGGWLENACRLYSAPTTAGHRVNTVRKTAGATLVSARFEPPSLTVPQEARPALDNDGDCFWERPGSQNRHSQVSRRCRRLGQVYRELPCIGTGQNKRG